MARFIVGGTETAFCWAFVLMLAATLIDATDGLLARAVGVKQALPGFDGRRLDDIIDFLTYTGLPLLLLWRAGVLPPGHEAWLLVPLVASAYGFCQVSAKTEDGYFVGFPSYWNLVAFYLYALDRHVVPLPGWLSIGVLVGLALLTFVPTRYLYPSVSGKLSRVTCLLGAIWAVLFLGIIYRLIATPGTPRAEGDGLLPWLILGSLFFPVYYMVASWAVNWQLWRTRRSIPSANCAPLPGGD
jgi:phosphatidylcholine synthase